MRDTPPYRAIPFRDRIAQRAGIAHILPWFHRVSRKYYEPADHLKNRNPNQEKCRKECFGKCRPQTGPLACASFYRRPDPEALFRHFPRHPVGAGTFRSTLFGAFPGRGFGTSLDGRQARNASIAEIPLWWVSHLHFASQKRGRENPLLFLAFPFLFFPPKKARVGGSRCFPLAFDSSPSFY